MSVVRGLITSKKFWVLVIGLVVVVLNRALDLGLTGDDLLAIGAADVAALIGIGLADFGKESAEKNFLAAEMVAALAEDIEEDPTEDE